MAGSILVVDDESLVRQTFGEVLAASGYEVTLADSGMAALALLDAARPDVVLLDIAMPGMNGLDTLARIISRRPRLPVVMITGNTDIDLATEAVRRGAADYVHKPVDLDDLARAVAVQMSTGDAPPPDVLELSSSDCELPAELGLWPAPSPAR
jgi:DNA-binding NtrC family response regulator